MAAAASFFQEIVKYDPFSGIERSGPPPKLFDVFINHRGPDVKDTLALQLYNSIKKMGFRPFLDSEEIELGYSILSALKNAIYSASVHIAIFSKRYAESAWCLAELVLMLQTRVEIIPVFYDVTPSDLRYSEKGVYADAFAKYTEKGRYLNELDEWKKALHSLSFISGYECSKHNNGHDKLCEIVTSAVLKELERNIPLSVAKHSVGLDEIVEDFERQCLQHKEKQSVQIVGIFGMGGSGKTTLAKAFFNRKRSEYDGSSFLFDVTEASDKSELPCLQIKLLKDLFREDRPKFHSTDEGRSYLRYRLGRGFFLRFLIVLDDINHMDQLDALVMTESLNAGSLVIVTTRDERVLMRAAIKVRYKMKEMNEKHSRELFCWHAFCQPYPSSGYDDLVESFMKECWGLPLSLKVLGGHVSGSTDKHYWRLELNKVRSNTDIKQRLKISYDALDREQKEIFMDIACFFIGKLKSTAIRIWEGSGWNAEHALQTLKDKCLVVEVEVEMTYWEDKWLVMNTPNLALTMHDHLRDLGKDLAAEKHSRPGRLWCPQDLKPLENKGFENIVTATYGHSLRCFHSFFESSVGGRITYFLGNSDCCAETSVALLSLEIYLREYQLISIPSWIPLQNLQRLRIVFGCLKRLWHSNAQAPFQLKELVLQQISIEDFSSSLEMLNQLQDLIIKGKSGQGNPMQISGKSLSKALRKLANLRSLILCQFRLSGELDLKDDGVSTTSDSPLSNLQFIKICDVKLAYKVSISGNHCPVLESLQLESMENLTEVDLTLVNTLYSLTVSFCSALKTISGGFDMDAKLAILNIQKCQQLEGLPNLECLGFLERVTIHRCQNLHSIVRIEEFEGLKYLHLSSGLSKERHTALTLSACRELKTLSASFNLGSFDLADLSCLERFIINRCWSLRNIKAIHLEGLKSLHLSGTEISLSNLLICGEYWPSLESVEVDLTLNSLTVRSCKRLKIISGSFDMPTKLENLNIEECPQFEELTSVSCLESITINGCLNSESITINRCLNLPNIKNIDMLKGLKSLNLSGREVCAPNLLICGEKIPNLEYLEMDLTPNSLTLRSCRILKSVCWSFYIATKLTILSIEECPQFQQLPNLAGLSCLERITIKGCLNLQYIGSIDNLEGLKCLHISRVGVYKVSVNGEHCHRLESVYLESMENLIEVNLTFVKSLTSLTIMSCRNLNAISLSFDLAAKLAILNITECPELEDLHSLAGQSCLERFVLNGCWKLQNLTGIEEFKALKHLHLSGGYKVIQNCIPRLQRLPSEVTIVIGEASYKYSSTDMSKLFVNMGGADAVCQIDKCIVDPQPGPEPEADLMFLFNKSQQIVRQGRLSAVIVCALVESYGSFEKIKIPFPRYDWTETQVECGRWMVTIVITEQNDIERARQDISDWIPTVSSSAKLKGGCIVTVNQCNESKVPDILTTIKNNLYKGG